jgi:hypothetical protein
MIRNIQVAPAAGLRSRTRWPRTVVYDPNGAPNLVSYGEPSSTCSIDTSVLAFCVGERVVHGARTATQVTPIVDFSPGELRVKTILGVTRQRHDLPFRVPPAQHVKNKIRQCLDVDSYLASSSVI